MFGSRRIVKKNQALNDIDTLYAGLGLPTIAQASTQAAEVIKNKIGDAVALETDSSIKAKKAQEIFDNIVNQAQSDLDKAMVQVISQSTTAAKIRATMADLQAAVNRLSKK